MLESALEYGAAGWRVFPCDSVPGPHAKAPLTVNGFKDATTEAQQIRTWWKSIPRCVDWFACADECRRSGC